MTSGNLIITVTGVLVIIVIVIAGVNTCSEQQVKQTWAKEDRCYRMSGAGEDCGCILQKKTERETGTEGGTKKYFPDIDQCKGKQ